MDARQFIVHSNEKGVRLDKWLSGKMSDLSRGQVKHLIDHGRVLVNHRRVLIAGWELEAEDNVEVRMPMGGVPEARETTDNRQQTTDNRQRTTDQKRPAPAAAPRNEKRSQRFVEVLFEDRDIIVVNKPYGVLTEPKGDSPHDNLLGMIKGYMKRKFKESRGSYVKLLHRLDKDTSGVVVAAKSKVGEQLETQFRAHRVERHYVAIVEGRINKEESKIDFPLEKGDFEGGKKARVSKQGGMPAITHYRVRERYANATLLDIRVETGRTHQVRVHFAELGHPVVGDRIYGSAGGGSAGGGAGTIPFSRHALHASMLGFKHPRTGQFQKIETRLPEDMTQLVDKLRGS